MLQPKLIGLRRLAALAICVTLGGLTGGCAASPSVPLPSLDRDDVQRVSAAEKKAEMEALVETGSIHEASAVRAIEKR